jgi:hypothetical protein
MSYPPEDNCIIVLPTQRFAEAHAGALGIVNEDEALLMTHDHSETIPADTTSSVVAAATSIAPPWVPRSPTHQPQRKGGDHRRQSAAVARIRPCRRDP